MKTITENLWLETKRHHEFINIAEAVDDIVRRSDIAEGFVLVSAMHIMAGVYINDAVMGLIADIEGWPEQLERADRTIDIMLWVNRMVMPA